MSRRVFDSQLVLVAIAAALAFGCKPEIGDECSVSTDCSSTGDRLCDTTQPNGYCTIFNCEPGTCPEEAICVAFFTSTSMVCQDPQDDDRLQRTYCMRRCDGDGDCRALYACRDMGVKNPWGAQVMEYGPTNGKVCIVPYQGTPLADNPNTEVCTGTDAGFDVEPWKADSGPSVDAGSDASDAAPDADDAGTDAPADAGADADDAAGDAADGGSDAATDA